MNRLELLPTDISISCLLPYIPPQDFDTFCLSCPRFEIWSQDPQNIRRYLSLRNITFFPYDALSWAVDNNSKILVTYFSSLGCSIHPILHHRPVKREDLEMIKLLLSLKEKEYDKEPKYSWSKTFEEYKIHNYNDVMRTAAFQGKIDIVKRMLEYGANDYDDVMYRACDRGDINMIRLMLDCGAKNYDDVLYHAIIRWKLGAQYEIVELMLKYGAKNHNQAIMRAAHMDNIEIVKLLLKSGANNLNELMMLAAQKVVFQRNHELMKIMLETGATNYDAAMADAISLFNRGPEE